VSTILREGQFIDDPFVGLDVSRKMTAMSSIMPAEDYGGANAPRFQNRGDVPIIVEIEEAALLASSL